MLKANIIRHSNSPWSFSVVLVGKSDKTKRLCVNYKRLNDITINDPFPIPLIGDILDRVEHFRFKIRILANRDASR
jgi:hypothetical protein